MRALEVIIASDYMDGFHLPGQVKGYVTRKRLIPVEVSVIKSAQSACKIK